MKQFALYIILSLTLFSYAIEPIRSQNKTIDSLHLILKTTVNDTNRVNYLSDLTREYLNTGAYKQALAYAEEGAVLAGNLNFKNGVGNCFNNIGNIYWYQGDYPEALRNFFLSLKIREELGDKRGIANSYNNIGIIYRNQGNYDEALNMHFEALKIREEVGDKRGSAASYNNIGIIFKNRLNYPDALKNYFASLKLMEQVGDKKGTASSYNNIGAIYDTQGKYQEALQMYNASLKIKEEIRDMQGIAGAYINIGTTLFNTKQNTEAKKKSERALSLSKEIGSTELIKDCYHGLAQIDSALGNFKQALTHFKLYIIYRDSLINEENTKKILKTSMQYEYDKKYLADSVQNAEEQKVKDAQILAQTAQIKQEKTQRYGLYGGLSLVLVFAGLIFNRFKVTQKQKEIIEIQKTEVENQHKLADNRRIIAEEQKEVITIKNKEIIDSINYAKRIQNAMLPSDGYIKNSVSATGNEVNYFILFQPKDIVSGDFYWFYKNENILYYMTADCTGHGVPGGFMSMLGINLLNEIVIERNISDPGEILNKLREEIVKALTTEDGYTKDGMDGVFCKIDYSKNTLEYAASNNAFYLIRNNELLKHLPQKMPIGYSDIQAPFETKTIALNLGDKIYTFTDGYADQFGGEKGKKYLYKKLEEKILSISLSSFSQQKVILTESFNNWKGNLEQVDDVCVIGLTIRKIPNSE